LALINGTHKLPKGLKALPAANNTSKTNAPTFTPNPAKPYAHPYYWAPFILMGNWL
jgi:CHAT domain-containing protein